jgi:hypothetical protein
MDLNRQEYLQALPKIKKCIKDIRLKDSVQTLENAVHYLNQHSTEES